MRSNFYIIGSPGLFEGTPRTFISGITAPGNPGEFASELGKTFPGVTAINLDMVLNRFRDLVNQGSKAISSVFVFTLVSAALVFAAILQGQSTVRAREIALMKTLGAGAKFVRRYTFLEMALLGGMAGFLGGTLAVATGVGLATYLFDLDIGFPWDWVAASTLVGMILVALVGYLAIRRTLTALPTALLKGSNFNPEFLRGETA